jgi:hypothetical protein
MLQNDMAVVGKNLGQDKDLLKRLLRARTKANQYL